MFRILDHPRLPFSVLLAVCAALLSFGLYLQHVEGIEPCPLCILQRYAFILVALIALIATFHGPRGTARTVYAALLILVSLIGAGIAARQSWIQIYPPELAECGPGLEYMLDTLPLAQALPKIFRGSGDCSVVDWTFLGLTIANCTLLCFSIFVVFALAVVFRRGPV